jgi:hypothetical protein
MVLVRWHLAEQAEAGFGGWFSLTTTLTAEA